MAIISSSNVKVTVDVTLKLTEEEALALYDLTLYGTDSFLKMFYAHLGEAYLFQHEAGLRSLFKAAGEIPNVTGKARRARELIDAPNPTAQ